MKRSFIVVLCRVLLGSTLVFSGAVKSVDPWGTALKIGEYLAAWGLPGLPDGVLAAASIAVCAAELALGLLLVAGVKKRLTSLVALALMAVFTALTVLSATVLPVEDCGCFGDAVRLAPWVSVAKNVVLMVFALAFWADVRVKKLRVKPVTTPEWVSMGASAAVGLAIGVWCFLTLPPVDFLPFKRGVDLYEAKYIDEAEGQITLRQFAVFNSAGDATHDLLSTPGAVYILVASRLEGLRGGVRERMTRVVRQAAADSARVVMVTGSPLSTGQTATLGGVPVELYNMDATTMISLLRARYGVVELYGGTIVGKKNLGWFF